MDSFSEKAERTLKTESKKAKGFRRNKEESHYRGFPKVPFIAM